MIDICKPILAIYLLLPFTGISQSLEYTYTADGSLVFSDVIRVDGKNRDALYAQAVEMFSNEGKIKKDSENKTVCISKSFTLYEKGILSSIPFAEIECKLFLEFKDQRYRYQLKDFDFLPYNRNRYGKYATVERKRKSLESVIQKSDEWEKVQDDFAANIISEIESIQLTMEGKLSGQEAESVSQVIKLKDEW